MKMAETYLIHRLNQMRMEGQLCDVHLVADDASTFPVHGLLLVAADEYFYRLVVNASNGPVVIKAGVSRPELESVVHFVYGVQSSGKQLEMGLQKMQMTRLLNKFANTCSSKRSEVGDTDMNGHVNNSNEVKPVININDIMDNTFLKISDYSVHNTCASDVNLHSPVKVKIEMKSVVELNPLDTGVSLSEHGETVSLKHILPENVKQECLLEKVTNNIESNHCSFSDEIPMPSLVKCETPRCIPSCSEERAMPTLEKIECKSARTPPGSFFPVIVKSEPISPPESPVTKVLHPDDTGIILENSGFACPETAYHVNQEATCSADHILPHCFKERSQSQNDFSSCNIKLGTEDTRLTVFTQSLPVIKTEEDCFGEMSDKYTLLENDMLILKDTQMLSIASTSETQIMQMNTASIHSGKVALPRASKLTDGNRLGTCTQFLDQSQNSALGLPIIQGIPLYSPIGQSHPAEGIIIQNPPGAMVTLVPSAVSNLHANFCATKFQQDMETYISSDKKQKCDPQFYDMKQTTHNSPAKNMNNSDISNFVVYPGKVMHNMGSNRGRKKFSKIPMIMRRNSVSLRKRSYDSLKFTDIIPHANDENTVEVESEKNTSSGGLMQIEEFNSSLNTAAIIDDQLNQSLSRTQNDHAAPSCIESAAEKPKTKCSRQTKPKFFHGYSSSFIPIAPKFEH